MANSKSSSQTSSFSQFFATARDREDKKLQDLIPVATFESGAFRFQDGSYMDMIQIVTKDLLNMSSDALAYDNLTMANFYKTYADDLKIIALNFPKSTKQQQKYYEKKILEERNPVYKKFLNQELDRLKEIEKKNTEREYYFLIFAKNLEDLHNKQLRVLHTLGNNGQVVEIEEKKKKQILEKLNNKNTSIFI